MFPWMVDAAEFALALVWFDGWQHALYLIWLHLVDDICRCSGINNTNDEINLVCRQHPFRFDFHFISVLIFNSNN